MEIATGVVSLVLSVIVLAYPGLGVASLVVIISFALIVTGISSLSIVGHGHLSKTTRILGAVFGILAIIFALVVLAMPDAAMLTLVELLAFGLILYGVSRIWLAYRLKLTPVGLRALLATVGVLSMIVSLLVLALPGVALLTLVALLAVALIFMGVGMVVSGAVGRTWLGDVAHAVEGAIKPDTKSL